MGSHPFYSEFAHLYKFYTRIAYSDPYRYYGRGGGPIHPKFFECKGTEERLAQCKIHNTTIVSTHSDDIGIYCGSGIYDTLLYFINNINVHSHPKMFMQ